MTDALARLDTLYQAWWDCSGTGKDEKSALLLGTLTYARRATGDDDAAADAVLEIINRFDRFYRKEPDSYGKWVSAICRRRRQKRLREQSLARSQQVQAFTPEQEDEYLPNVETDDHLPELQLTEPWQQQVADTILSGGTLRDSAASLGITLPALKKRLQRLRTRNSAPDLGIAA